MAYHERAAAEGTRIIPCCGFDSVPSDLGALLVARKVTQAFGAQCVEVRAYFQVFGSFNGGTVASALHEATSEVRREYKDLFLLNPPGLHSQRQADRSRDISWPMYDQVALDWPILHGSQQTPESFGAALRCMTFGMSPTVKISFTRRP